MTSRPRLRNATGKRRRSKLAKAELWMSLAVTAEGWADQIDGADPATKPLDEWPADDLFVTLCRTYKLSPADLARLCRQIGQEVENRALNAGYDEIHVDPGRPYDRAAGLL